MNIIIDKQNKTINNQDPIEFINFFIDGKEDYYPEYESEFVDSLSNVVFDSETGEYTYNDNTYDQAYQVIYSDPELVIQWFEFMIDNEYI
jgi:hypothetical protein